MNLSSLSFLADDWKDYAEGLTALGNGRAVEWDGLPVPSRGWLLARLTRDLDRPLFVVTANDETAERLVRDLSDHLDPGEPVRLFPSALRLLLDDADSERDVRRAGMRLRLIGDLADGLRPRVIVAPACALLSPLPSLETIRSRRIDLKAGDSVALDTLVLRLNAFGYAREDLVRSPGTFARRGDILDIYPSDGDEPVRIDLFGDDIEAIRRLDPATQRSTGSIDSIRILPAHEIAHSRERMAEATTRLKSTLQSELARRRAENADEDRLERLRDHVESEIL
ncbi:MAG: hypothetical protein ACKO5K_05410, partial [Armatimonadota bacterium]